MVKSDWRTVNVKKSLLEQIEKIIADEEIRNEGITNTSQFIDSALKEKLEEFEQKRFSHQNTYEDKVRILDNKIGKMGDIVTIYLKEDQKEGFCDYCEKADCVHVKYMWEIKDVVDILKERGFKSPYDESTK